MSYFVIGVIIGILVILILLFSLLLQIISKLLYGKSYSKLSMKEKKDTIKKTLVVAIVSSLVGAIVGGIVGGYFGAKFTNDFYKKLQEEKEIEELEEFKKVVGTLYIYNVTSSNMIYSENILLSLYNGKHEVFEKVKFILMFCQFYNLTKDDYSIIVLENKSWMQERMHKGTPNFPNETVYYWDYIMYNETINFYLRVKWNYTVISYSIIEPRWNIMLGDRDIETKVIKYETPSYP